MNDDTKLSLKSVQNKESLSLKNSRASELSVTGSKFGRSILKNPVQNDPELMRTLSTINSRAILTVFNPNTQNGSKLPNLKPIDATDCIRQLGSLLNIEDYEFNYASFWLLDVVSKLIKDLQLENVSQYCQSMALAWFRFILRTIAVNIPTREELFCFLQELFKNASAQIIEGNPIPYPENLRVSSSSSKIFQASEQSMSLKSDISKTSKSKRSLLSLRSGKKGSRKSLTLSSRKSMSKRFSQASGLSTLTIESDKKQNLEAFYRIIELIYLVFGDRFTYNMVSLAYGSPKLASPLEIKINFEDPKPLKPKLSTPPPSPVLRKSKEKKQSRTASRSKKGSPRKSKGKSSKKSKGSSIMNKSIKDVENNQKDEKGAKLKDKPGKKKGKKDKPSVITDDQENIVKEEETKGETTKNKEAKGSKAKSKKKQDKKRSVEVKEADQDVEQIRTSTKKKNPKKLSKEKKPGKGKSRRSRSFPEKISGATQLHEDNIEEINYKLKVKLFERIIPQEMILEEEKFLTKDKYVLPLSDAVGKDFVENIIKTLTPQEIKPVEDPTPKQIKKEVSTGSEKKRSRASKPGSSKNLKKGKKKKINKKN